MEWFLRHSITYPVLGRVFRNQISTGVVDLSGIRSILVLRYDRFGDMVVTSPITRHLRVLAPKARIDVAASASNAQLARHLPGVDNIHVVTGSLSKVAFSLLRARAVGYDLVLNFIMNRTSTGGILANVIAPQGLKVGQGAEKYGFYFNRMLSLGKGRTHMVNLLDAYCAAVFGAAWGRPDLRYEILPDSSSEERVTSFLMDRGMISGRDGGDMVVLNMSAGEKRRDPSPDQIVRVARYLAEKKQKSVVLVGSPDQIDRISSIRKAVGHRRVHQYPQEGSAPFMDMVSLIRRARYLVSPDTSLVHIACATDTPLVGFYSSLIDFSEWSPVGVSYESVFDENGAAVKDIPVENIAAAIDRLESKTQEKGRS